MSLCVRLTNKHGIFTGHFGYSLKDFNVFSRNLPPNSLVSNKLSTLANSALGKDEEEAVDNLMTTPGFWQICTFRQETTNYLFLQFALV